MGKRKHRQSKQKKAAAKKNESTSPKPDKRLKTEYIDPTTVKNNLHLEQYYKEVLKPYLNESKDPESEFASFLETLRVRLPVTFRINSNILNYEVFMEKVKDPNWISELISKQTKELKEKKPEQT